MDKIWDKNPSKSEVIGRCGLDEKKRMATQNRQKSNAKKRIIYKWILCSVKKSNKFKAVWGTKSFVCILSLQNIQQATLCLEYKHILAFDKLTYW